MMPPSIWLARPSGLMMSPESTAAHARGTDLDIGDHRHIGGEVLVLGKSDPAALAAAPLFARLPIGLLCHGLDNRPPPRVFQMGKAERHRVGGGRKRQLVEEG